VQDAASQYAAAALGAEAGQVVIDLCAGAGGKTLAIASATNDEAAILACDTNRARLQQLAPRAHRAGATAIETLLLNPGQERAMLADRMGKADRVIVDAPCSGSGTWRRSPELRWRSTPARLDRQVAEQAKLIDIGADLVAPGGKLLYAVCSIITREGRAQVDEFSEPASRLDGRRRLSSGRHRPRCGGGYLLTPGQTAAMDFSSHD
jgi:16S rRNA (cytosine967-C5)-methyltransferase